MVRRRLQEVKTGKVVASPAVQTIENTENLDIYKRSRQTFKSHCNAKKSVYNSNVLDDLVSSHANPKSFWNKLKRLAGASTTHNNISKEQWKAHFEMLFASQEFERDMANDNAIDDNIEYNILDDELEDIVLTLLLQMRKLSRQSNHSNVVNPVGKMSLYQNFSFTVLLLFYP